MNKIKKSLVVQTTFLFFVSFLVIGLLWIFFYAQQKYQHLEYDTARYFNITNSLESYFLEKKDISQELVSIFSMKIASANLPSNYELLMLKGDKNKGFKVLLWENRQYLYIYNNKNSILLEDVSTHRSMVLIHLVFILLLITQGLLYIKLQRSLFPLSSLHNKLKKLKAGDLSKLQIDSNYDEIKQMINSYNDSISKIENMLELREMFNKIFMHEMKMPLAKGMFYLKQNPSSHTHEKLTDILHGLNDELDEFSQIESLISSNNRINKSENDLYELIDIAKQRIHADDKNIILKNCEDRVILGDREFWILCFKNLLDNALKYSFDKKVIIDASDGIMFINKAQELPFDISADIKNWKIDKNKRHKSSTGYGFGLFIIKNIVTINNYKLKYSYNKENQELILGITL